MVHSCEFCISTARIVGTFLRQSGSPNLPYLASHGIQKKRRTQHTAQAKEKGVQVDFQPVQRAHCLSSTRLVLAVASNSAELLSSLRASVHAEAFDRQWNIRYRVGAAATARDPSRYLNRAKAEGPYDALWSTVKNLSAASEPQFELKAQVIKKDRVSMTPRLQLVGSGHALLQYARIW